MQVSYRQEANLKYIYSFGGSFDAPEDIVRLNSAVSSFEAGQ